MIDYDAYMAQWGSITTSEGQGMMKNLHDIDFGEKIPFVLYDFHHRLIFSQVTQL